MRFTPKSEDELSNLLPDGVYDFEVVTAEDAVSKKGNDMIAVTLKVYGHDGSPVTVFDYLLESVLYKIAHIAQATGLQAKYEAGMLEASDLLNRAGKVKIGTQAGQDGYPPRNVVKDYMPAPRAATPPARRAPAEQPIIDDSIPF